MTVRIHDLLKICIDEKASDIHFSAGDVPAIRVDGEIHRLKVEPLTNDDAKRLAYSMMQERQRTQYENNLETDFAISFKGIARFRVNVYNQTRGIGVVMRQIPTRVLTMEELGMAPVFKRIAGFKRGLVLVTGPTGSGKSTTLAAIIDHINKNRREHILTIEDPVEFVHVPDKCIINQREVGSDTRSFAAALRSALREDPDVILVSELRDVETIRTAIVAAETGHLVLGTLHTRDAAATVSRLLDVFPPEETEQVRTMVAASLRAVVCQRLIPREGGGGRVPAYEILRVTPAVASLVRDGRAYQIPSQLQIGRRQGMIDLDARLEEMVAAGLVSAATARAHAKSPARFLEEGGDAAS